MGLGKKIGYPNHQKTTNEILGMPFNIFLKGITKSLISLRAEQMVRRIIKLKLHPCKKIACKYSVHPTLKPNKHNNGKQQPSF